MSTTLFTPGSGGQKTWIVTLAVITGYHDNDYDQPIVRYDEYTVVADTEREAIMAAKDLDKTGFSIYESWASETEGKEEVAA